MPLVNRRSLSCRSSKVTQNGTVYWDLDLGSELLRGSIQIDKVQQEERPRSHRAKSPTTHQAVEPEQERQWYRLQRRLHCSSKHLLQSLDQLDPTSSVCHVRMAYYNGVQNTAGLIAKISFNPPTVSVNQYKESRIPHKASLVRPNRTTSSIKSHLEDLKLMSTTGPALGKANCQSIHHASYRVNLEDM